MSHRYAVVLLLVLVATSFTFAAGDNSLQLTLRNCVETTEGRGDFKTVISQQQWDPTKTAVIVCDMWDAHHCLNAVPAWYGNGAADERSSQ